MAWSEWKRFGGCELVECGVLFTDVNANALSKNIALEKGNYVVTLNNNFACGGTSHTLYTPTITGDNIEVTQEYLGGATSPAAPHTVNTFCVYSVKVTADTTITVNGLSASGNTRGLTLSYSISKA